MRRIHPRHVTETVQLEEFEPAGWLGSWAAARPVRCQVEYQRKLVDLDGDVTATTLLVLRVPPASTGLMFTEPLDSRVTYDDQVSWVIAARPVLRQGRMVYLELTTGDRLRRFGGSWVVDVVHHHSPGRDRRGNLQPGDPDETLTNWLISPGTSTEVVDLDEGAETTAKLYGPPGHTFEATDSVTVTSSPLAGLWDLTGAPAYYPDRTEVPLRRSR